MLSGLRKGFMIAFMLLLITAFAVGTVDGKTVTYTKNITLNSEVQNFSNKQQMFFDTPDYFIDRFSSGIGSYAGAGGQANPEAGYSDKERFFALIVAKRNIIDTIFCDETVLSRWDGSIGKTIFYGFERKFYAFNFTNPGIIFIYSEYYPFPEADQHIQCDIVQINATTLTYKYQAEVGAGVSLRDLLS